MSRGTGKTCTSRVALPCLESVTLSCAPYYVFAIQSDLEFKIEVYVVVKQLFIVYVIVILPAAVVYQEYTRQLLN